MSESIGEAQYRLEYSRLFVIELSVYWALDGDRTSGVELEAGAGSFDKLFDIISFDVRTSVRYRRRYVVVLMLKRKVIFIN